MDQHRIEETRLVTRRSARDQIHLAWNHQCAYCGDHLGRSPTLDHVIPRLHGGMTVQHNLVAACQNCNGRKGASPLWAWWQEQPYWDFNRALAVYAWLSRAAQQRSGTA